MMSEGQIVIAALLPHAPVLVSLVGGKRLEQARTSVNSMAEVARSVVAAQPETLIVISPHAPRRRQAFALGTGDRTRGSLVQFGVPEAAVDLPGDPVLAETLRTEAQARGVQVWSLPAEELDHGATVPLWFLAAAGWRGPTLVVGLNYPGEPGRQELGAAIRAAAMRAERRVGIIASGDMSHCLRPGAPAGFHPRAKEFDAAFIGILRAGRYRDLLNFDGELQLLAAEDALDATVIAAAAVNWDATGHKVLSYEGPFGVGYGVALLHASLPERDSVGALQAATRERTDPSGGSHLPEIARQSIEAAFGRKVTLPTATAGILAEAHGVFVTIRDQAGNLRGCVGTVTPHCANTAAETWRLAREAAFHDGRFRPMRSAELADVRFEVSVICSLEEVAAEELAPQGYGVSLLTPDGRHGVLLPALAGVETVAQQLAIARRKGGIAPDEPVQTRRFTVKKFCERQPAEHPHECHSG